MKTLMDLNISSKLLIPMVVMAILFACVVGLAAFELRRITGEYGQMTERLDPTVVRLVPWTSAWPPLPACSHTASA